MDMHQAGDTPDWTQIPPKARNFWQQIAADTQGFGTPGNALSVLGFTLVVAGLWVVVARSLWEGTFLVGIGRLADLGGGVIAQHTVTQSPVARRLCPGLYKQG